MKDRTEVGIVAAMERELADLVRGWRVILGPKYRYYERDGVIAVCGGIGEKCAREAAEAVLTFRAPQVLISAGMAGALVPGLSVGAVVLPTKVLSATGVPAFTIEGRDGALISFLSVTTPSQKRELAARFGAIAVDMEAASVAEVAQRRGVRFAAVKAISDELDFRMPELGKFIGPDGKFGKLSFALYAAVRPAMWPGLAALQRNAAIASGALCTALSEIRSAADVDAMLKATAKVS